MSSNFYRASAKDFQKIPGSPFAYWFSEQAINAFTIGSQLGSAVPIKSGMSTSDNARFLRLWHEVDRSKFHTESTTLEDAKSSSGKWFPFKKGGEFRRWNGNSEYVLNWKDDGREIKESVVNNPSDPNTTHWSRRIFGVEYFFKRGITWTKISGGRFAARYHDIGFIFSDASNGCFPSTNTETYLGFLNSIVCDTYLRALAPTLNFKSGDIAKLPIFKSSNNQIEIVVKQLVRSSHTDWNNYETSWDFTNAPLLRPSSWTLGNSGTGSWKDNTLETSWNNWKHYCDSAIARMQELETENNRLWIDAYGLNDELTPEVPEKEITLARADQAKDMAAFLSYAVGCMMGRFSLDAEGLIMANSGETLEDYLAKVNLPLEALQFAPDDDGIIPVLDDEWFDDDIVGRTKEFLRVTFGDDTLSENIDFIEQSLGKSLRKYFCTDFYKNHISNERAYGYKKRPIYWLVQSPKKSFQALIYLHRYTKDTMNLVLNNYLREFEAKLENRLDHLAHIITSESASSPDKTKAQKETDKIKASLNELDAWQKDILFPIASQRIELDLDDGVKANYPKLGKTLAKIPGVSKK